MPIRQIKIDYTAPLPEVPIMAGYMGEHNATELLIIPPAELTGDEVKSYTAAFETGGKIYRSRTFEPGEAIKIPLWQQLTAERLLCVQLEARGADGELIAKAPAVHGLTLLPSPQGAAAEAETGSADLASEVAANTAARHKHSNKAVLAKLAEDNKGRLTYGGKAIVDEVISSLKKWDGGALLMGYDTLVNGDYLDRSLRLISSAIQDKSRLHGSIAFDDFASRISALPDDALSKLLHGTLTEYVNATPTAIPADLFKGQDKLQKIDMTSVKSVGNNAFRECSALVEVKFPVLETLGSAAFIHCSALAEVKFPAVLSSGVAVNALRYCSALKKVDFGEINAAKGLLGYSLADCKVLEMLVIRNTDQPPKLTATAFNNTPINTGTGYIYVPAAMVDAYKSATNWSAYADQIRAIEDYPEITGGDGA